MDALDETAAPLMGRPYNSIGTQEYAALGRMFIGDPERPLSGYVATKERGGVYVEALEDLWREIFQVRHAIACNSNTSGLLAAAFAIDLKAGDQFVCPAMTMTATAAAPMFTGATPWFSDIDDKTFGVGGPELPNGLSVLATNLFGHPTHLRAIRAWCDAHRKYLIEDNAQAPFATERGRYAGTIGHIGVFSLNVHKHFHCGEGGVIVTDDDYLAIRMRGFINHGENRLGPIGLNLRMPEMCAAVALVQTQRGVTLVEDRRRQAQDIITAIGDVPGLRHPVVHDDCTHSYYMIPWLIEKDRDVFVGALRDLGVPLMIGYQEPLYRLPAFMRFRPEVGCPIAEDLQDRRLFCLENCAYTFSDDEIARIGDAFRKAAEVVDAQAPRRV